MFEELAITCTGDTTLTATDPTPRPIQLILTCPQGLAAGTDVRVGISTFHSYTTDWRLDGVRIENGSGRVVVGHELPRDWTEMTRGGVGPAGGGLIGRPINEVHLCLVQITQALTPGARLVFALDVLPSIHAGVEGALLVKARPQGSEAFVPVGEAIPLPNRAGAPVRLEARATAEPTVTGPTRVVLFATDEKLNPVPDYRATLTIQSQGEDGLADLPSVVEIGPDDGGRCQLDVSFASKQGQQITRIQVCDPARDLTATSNALLSASSGALNHYFGAIHFHTRLSVDGDRDPRAAYAYARDFLNLDVVAMTDHAPIGAGWEECLAVNEEFYQAGRFVTIPAWESSNAYGHANLYLRAPDVAAGPWYWNPEVNPSEVEWPDDVVMVPHHTNTGATIVRGTHRDAWRRGVYWGKYDWSIPNARARLVEIVQGRSNFEADALDADWGITMGGQGASVRDALAQAWRLGFVAGTDNHEGYPTQRGGRYVGLTCFRAPELTREAIWQAMDGRHTYATSGVPIVCDFAVNGAPSGDAVQLAPGEPVTFSAQLHGTAPIDTVEIISGGRCVWQQQPHQWDVTLDGLELPGVEGAWAYYYLRLRQADGHRAWLSPVWVERGAAV